MLRAADPSLPRPTLRAPRVIDGYLGGGYAYKVAVSSTKSMTGHP